MSLYRRFHDVAIKTPRIRLVARALAELTEHADSLLDVGCGDGTVAESVGRAVGARRVEGVDVLLQRDRCIPVTKYDGVTLPFADASYDVVLVSDVLHHADDPARVLSEATRVASRAVVVKDHFAFGPASRRMLLALDVLGNREYGIAVSGRYLHPRELLELSRACGLRVERLLWPLDVHPPVVRSITRSELQFAARLVPVGPT